MLIALLTKELLLTDTEDDMADKCEGCGEDLVSSYKMLKSNCPECLRQLADYIDKDRQAEYDRIRTEDRG